MLSKLEFVVWVPEEFIVAASGPLPRETCRRSVSPAPSNTFPKPGTVLPAVVVTTT